MSHKELNHIVFDVECLENEWEISFFDVKNKTFKTIHDNDLLLIDYIERNKSNSLFIGFNNKWFDNHCIKCIYNGKNPHLIVQGTIKNKGKPWNIGGRDDMIRDILFADLMDDSGGVFSLKEIGGNLGEAIIESPIDFDITKKLSLEDYNELLKYNEQDCLVTAALLEQKKADIISKQLLCELYGISYVNMNKTFAGLMSVILKAEKTYQNQSFEYKCPTCIELKDRTPIEKYEQKTFEQEKDDFEYSHRIKNLDIDLGLGGDHGGIKNYFFKSNDKEILILLDVKQMYLNLMANKENPEFRFYPKGIPSWRELAQLMDLRESLLKDNKIKEATAVKLGGNAVYGSTNYINSPFYDWINNRNICITGQLCNLMLCEYMADIVGVELINVNTDGIFIKAPIYQIENIKEKAKLWSDKLNLNLKVDIIYSGAIYQKDVNNYILVNGKEIITKGKFVNKWNGGTYKSNSGSIIDQAVVEYFVNNKPINKTVIEAFNKNEAIKFQLIFSRKGVNYKTTYHGDKIVQKTNRVFASSNEKDPILTKMKDASKHKFPDCPEHCIIDNRSIKDINLYDMELDLDYYINSADKRIKAFQGR